MKLSEELRNKQSRDNRALLDRAADRIDELEARLREQSEGEWKLIQDGKGVCSACHRQDVVDRLAHFCRYCGAKMKGDQPMEKQIEITELLEQYSVCKRFLDSQAYAMEYFNPYDTQRIDDKEQYEARIHVIESLIRLLEPSNEYTILRLHYIKGISIEKCSECMQVSRRTAYRLLNKAKEKLFDLVNKKGGAE